MGRSAGIVAAFPLPGHPNPMRLTPIQVPLVPRPLAPLLILALLVLAVLALVATAQRITINTDTADMISADLPFRAAYERYREAFPAHVDMLAVVVDAPTPEGATLAARQLATRLTDRPDLYQEVFLAGDGAWFERNALLWSEPAELDELAERLVSVQPLLGLLTADPTLQGFARTLERSLRWTRSSKPSWQDVPASCPGSSSSSAAPMPPSSAAATCSSSRCWTSASCSRRNPASSTCARAPRHWTCCARPVPRCG